MVPSAVGVGHDSAAEGHEEAGGLPGGHVPRRGDVALAQDAGEVRDEVVGDAVEGQAVAELGACMGTIVPRLKLN